MGDLKNKKTALSITTIILGVGAVVAFFANLGQIKESWFSEKDKSSSSKVKSSVVEVKPKEEINVSPEVDVPDESFVEETPQPIEPSVVYLDELKVAESEGRWRNSESLEDTIGNKYVNHLINIGDDYECYGTYYLGGKYKTLSGTIAVEDLTDKDRIQQLCISVDNNVVYTTDELTRTTAPIEFSINIENCQWLRIDDILTSNTYCWGGYLILYNWKLE